MTRNNQENHLKSRTQGFIRQENVGTQHELHFRPPLQRRRLFLIKLSGDESKIILRLLLRISQNVNKRIFVVASGSAAALLHMRALMDRQQDCGADGARAL